MCRKKKRTFLNFQILKGMHFIHVNARSILPKMSELRIMAKESKAAVIAISEIWLDSSVTNSEIQIEGIPSCVTIEIDMEGAFVPI